MFFEKLVSRLQFSQEPAFTVIHIRDTNVLAGSSKKRFIEKPNESMTIIHGRLLGYLRDLLVEVDCAYAAGCLPGCSPLKNIKRHRDNRFFYLLDLHHAYRFVDLQRLAALLCQADPALFGQEETANAFLMKYCLSRFGGLPMGAPSSPDLFNLYCLFLIDKPLGEIVEPREIVYTRYLDDLTFSSAIPLSRDTRKKIREIIGRAGFQISHRKSKVVDTQKGPVFINGIGLDVEGRIFVPGRYHSHILGLIHRWFAGQPSLCHKIEGAMGVFRDIVKGRKLSRTEQRVIEAYKRFRMALKLGLEDQALT